MLSTVGGTPMRLLLLGMERGLDFGSIWPIADSILEGKQLFTPTQYEILPRIAAVKVPLHATMWDFPRWILTENGQFWNGAEWDLLFEVCFGYYGLGAMGESLSLIACNGNLFCHMVSGCGISARHLLRLVDRLDTGFRCLEARFVRNEHMWTGVS
ncbi:hypothetical protein V6N11_010683 [Hibiscus sabdariffa]|uniref:Uncharacterized protein n=1 Tax=Hibiscus sabdariffa TaxID=183260 RepID=A0ABR2S5Z9_9ROSI